MSSSAAVASSESGSLQKVTVGNPLLMDGASDRLNEVFSGSALSTLSGLGVTAYSPEEIEKQVESYLESQAVKRPTLERIHKIDRRLKAIREYIEKHSVSTSERQEDISRRKYIAEQIDRKQKEIEDLSLERRRLEQKLARLNSDEEQQRTSDRSNSPRKGDVMNQAFSDRSNLLSNKFDENSDWEKQRVTGSRRKFLKIADSDIEIQSSIFKRKRYSQFKNMDDADDFAFSHRLSQLSGVYSEASTLANTDKAQSVVESDEMNNRKEISKNILDSDGEHFSASEDWDSDNLDCVEDCEETSPAVDREIWKDTESSGEDVVFEGDFILPSCIYDRLFEYQKQGIRWLWELHQQTVGGIVGDEMGLGKTIQVIAFLAGLHYSPKIKSGAILIVCPASMLSTWMKEFHKWYPYFRVMILHEAGNHISSNEQIISKAFHPDGNAGEGNVVITTYAAVRNQQKLLIRQKWHYVILDEGHIIRNPDTLISLSCKRFRTYHRLLLTGTPIQNRLRELWSLFDFIFPGKLGTLPVFEEQFCVPITIGGYTHASPQQVRNAYQCAMLLRDMVIPHILRRTKKDVNAELPKKEEHVLFCNLSQRQLEMYKSFLAGREVECILSGDLKNRNIAFMAISFLRKICNHPDLISREEKRNRIGSVNKSTYMTTVGDESASSSEDEEEIDHEKGNVSDSGKLTVLRQILQLWKSEKHRVLIFSQTRQMLDIIEKFMINEGHSYLRMDGTTGVKSRGPMMDEFNQNISIFAFLLTTRTGGFGVNLTGANRVILYDPDWNPSTDEQARERVYRIGQRKDVIIYRLITRGTIEEKVYHRQLFKKFLSNKVLNDPSQKRLFNASDLRDLFTLTEKKVKCDSETNDILNEVDAELRTKESISSDDSRAKANTELNENDSGEDCASSSDVANEKRFLKALFSNSQLESTFSHDKILNFESKDRVLVEHQASKVAERALEALKRSRKSMESLNVGIPTWTGKTGHAGRLGSASSSSKVSRFGGVSSSSSLVSVGSNTSSSSLLETIRNRKDFIVSDFPKAGLEDPNSRMEKIREVLANSQNGIGSVELSKKFAAVLKTAEDQILFKKMLKKVANFSKRNGVWTLKTEFR